MLYLSLALLALATAATGLTQDNVFAIWGVPTAQIEAGTFVAAEVDNTMQVTRTGVWRVVAQAMDSEFKLINQDLARGVYDTLMELQYVEDQSDSGPHADTRPLKRVMTASNMYARDTVLGITDGPKRVSKRADQPSALQDAVQAAVDGLNASRWQSDLEQLETWNRYYIASTGGDYGLEEAGDWLMTELSAALAPAGSRTIAVERRDPLQSTLASYNIFGGITGSVNPDRYIVIGAHMDATSESPSTAAPGIEDNGSGCANLLAMARALGAVCTENNTDADLCRTSIYFVFFTGEEAGLLGSYEFVDNMGDAELRDNLVVAHIMDMVAYWHDPNDGDPRVYIETYSRHLDYLLDSYEPALDYCTNGLSISTYTNPFGSDHMPFLDMGGDDQGVPCALVIDYDYADYPYYHMTTDTFDKVNEDIAMDIIRMSLAAVVDFSYQDTATTGSEDTNTDNTATTGSEDTNTDHTSGVTDGASVSGPVSFFSFVALLLACFN